MERKNGVLTPLCSRGHLGRRNALKLVTRRAMWTFAIMIMSVKYGMALALYTVGTKVMHWIFALCGLAQAIHNRTGWRFPKFIALEVGFKCLMFCQFFLELLQHGFQFRIRELRICHLRSEFAQSQFDIRISRRLRFLEKRLQGAHPIGQVPSIGARMPNELNGLTQGVEIEVHEMLQNQKIISEQILFLREAKRKGMKNAAT